MREESVLSSAVTASSSPTLTICRSSSADVQLAAINALYNSLEFVRENFSREVCIPAGFC